MKMDQTMKMLSRWQLSRRSINRAQKVHFYIFCYSSSHNVHVPQRNKTFTLLTTMTRTLRQKKDPRQPKLRLLEILTMKRKKKVLQKDQPLEALTTILDQISLIFDV